jgi:hypothetical protein
MIANCMCSYTELRRTSLDKLSQTREQPLTVDPPSQTMAAQANGRAKKPKKAASNGTLNGSLNGHANGHMNGHANGHADKSQSLSTTSRPTGQRKPKKTITGTATSMVAR